ncbi:MAG TPA: D-alanyl-D-alanine carboxypeptidase family protein [Patescibacteria group bacterium]|nr:D-alanyl-D-alanine carboxypeptidase family protein [Patescibacteria group bacterium]
MILGIIFTVFALMPLPAGAVATPDIQAKSAILIDATTGRVFYAKAEHARRYPASTTKMLTLITALEKGNLGDTVVASQRAATTEGSTIWLTAGETLKLSDLLYGAILASGNDATVAIAEHIAGSVEEFAELMNEKARQIGANESHFTNASGLPDLNHYSTAYDLAKIAAYGYKNPSFVDFVSVRRQVLPWTGKEKPRELYTENKLLWTYEGANGVKTGYTDAAGRCVIAAAQRNGIQLIAVILDSPIMWTDSMKLLDYGFVQLQPVELVKKNERRQTLPVLRGTAKTVQAVSAASIVVPMTDSEREEYQVSVQLPARLEAPVRKGEKIGIAKVLFQGQEVAATDLIADRTVERLPLLESWWSSLWGFFSQLVMNENA